MTNSPTKKTTKKSPNITDRDSGSDWLAIASRFRRQGDINMAIKCAYEAEKYALGWGYIHQYDLGMTFRNLDLHHRAVYWLIIAAWNGDPDAAKDINTLYGIQLNME